MLEFVADTQLDTSQVVVSLLSHVLRHRRLLFAYLCVYLEVYTALNHFEVSTMCFSVVLHFMLCFYSVGNWHKEAFQELDEEVQYYVMLLTYFVDIHKFLFCFRLLFVVIDAVKSFVLCC